MIGAKQVEEMGEVRGENRKLFVQVISLLKRLLQGEEVNEGLFLILEKFHRYLSENILDKENTEYVEYLTVLRILNSLGYVKNSFENLLSNSELNEGVITEVFLGKDHIVKAINDGLKESQL